MASQRSRSLIPWAARSHRVATCVLGLGLGFVALVTGPAWVAEAKTLHISLARLASEGEKAAAGLSLLLGPADRLDTIGGYLSYKLYPTFTVLLAIYSALQGARIIRGSENRGIFDLWFAAGRSRNSIIKDRCCGFLISLGAILVMLYAGTVAGGALSHAQLALPALGQCVATGLVAATAFALSLMLSQFCQTSRVAAATSSAYIVIAYLVANSYESLGSASFLKFLSPFFYYETSRTLVPGVGFNPLAMTVMLGAAAVFMAVAWRLYLQRDTGGVSLARINRARPEEYTFRPTMIRQRTLWLTAITEQPVALVSWFLGIAAFSAIEASLVPAVKGIVGTTLSKAVDGSGAALTVDQYVSFLLSYSAILVAAFVVTQVGRWTSDAETHRIDMVLSQPVSVLRFVMGRALALVVLSLVVGVAVVAGTWIGAQLGDFPVHVAGLARTFGVIVLFSCGIGGAGMVLSAVLRSAAATAGIAALLVASFLLQTLALLVSWPSWTLRPSVFDAFGSPYQSLPSTGGLIYLLMLAILGAGATFGVMRWGPRIAV